VAAVGIAFQSQYPWESPWEFPHTRQPGVHERAIFRYGVAYNALPEKMNDPMHSSGGDGST